MDGWFWDFVNDHFDACMFGALAAFWATVFANDRLIARRARDSVAAGAGVTFAALLICGTVCGGCASPVEPSGGARDDLAARLVVGSESALSYAAWIDPSIDYDTATLILDGIAAWPANAPELSIHANIGSCPEGPHVICYRLGTPDEQVTYSEQNRVDAYGVTLRTPSTDSALVILFPSVWGTYGETTATHETGHAMGLSHTWTDAGGAYHDDVGAVMCGGPQCSSREITPTDVAQFRFVHSVDL